MFTDEEKKIKNWRNAKRILRKARNKRDRLVKKLAAGRYDASELTKLKNAVTNAKVRVSVLELKIGDKPE